MKKYAQWAVSLALCLALAQSGRALAASVTITDTINEWGWNDRTTGLASQDVNGAPDITQIIVSWDNTTGQLQTVTVYMNYSSNAYFPHRLFINTGYTGTGDVTNSDNFAALQDWDWYATTNDGLYSVGDGYTYLYATSGRTDHINGIASGLTDVDSYGSDAWQTGQANFTSSGLNYYVYDFAMLASLGGPSIYLGEQFAIGYVEYCANDVVLGYGATGITPPAVPEPATLSLLGVGIVGLASWHFRRSPKKK
ncbi:MAG: PEP-CTERM sorting domain-containing protein [Acidobacteriota bacterium]|jgi:hypothetical protein|nr:PEP-CTERM sorting domain-containing protein [Acidobacteriota bacterium]